MSADSVDDIHAAEDMAASLATALKSVLEPEPNFSKQQDKKATALAVLDHWANYCRPTCGAEGDPEDEDCDEGEFCGCPCGHAEED